MCLPLLLDVLLDPGVDVHAEDALGKLALSNEGIAARDDFVMHTCAEAGVPVAAAIGGGYQSDHHHIVERWVVVTTSGFGLVRCPCRTSHHITSRCIKMFANVPNACPISPTHLTDMSACIKLRPGGCPNSWREGSVPA
jgi:hypothetical protein